MKIAEQEQGPAPPEALGGKHLTFDLGGEVYGLAILKVQEIIKSMAITRVPRALDSVRGVINLRGKVIPVFDLRARFGMDTIADTERTCIIVVEVHASAGAITVGVLVDGVCEVLDIAAKQIEPPPVFGGAVRTAFLLGMGKVGDKVVMLLDMDQVLSGEEAAMVDRMAREDG